MDSHGMLIMGLNAFKFIICFEVLKVRCMPRPLTRKG